MMQSCSSRGRRSSERGVAELSLVEAALLAEYVGNSDDILSHIHIACNSVVILNENNCRIQAKAVPPPLLAASRCDERGWSNTWGKGIGKMLKILRL
jgi:hypothetical protein